MVFVYGVFDCRDIYVVCDCRDVYVVCDCRVLSGFSL